MSISPNLTDVSHLLEIMIPGMQPRKAGEVVRGTDNTTVISNMIGRREKVVDIKIKESS